MPDNRAGLATRFASAHRAFIRSAWVLYPIVLVAAMLLPSDSVPDLGFFGWDKVAHLGVFVGLSVLTGAAYSGLNRMTLLVLLYGAFFGVFTEMIQAFAPGRIPSVFDVLANLAGTILGAFLARSFLHGAAA